MNKARKLGFWIKRHKTASLFIAIAVLLILISISTKILLYVNLLLGNDTIISLTVDKQDLFLLHGQEEQIEFRTEVTSNPFCTVACESKFIDIGKNSIIEQDKFELRPSIPLVKEFTLKPSPVGRGLDLYRFDIECSSKGNILCHTKEEPSTRSILITIRYDLSEEESILKAQLKDEIEELDKNFLYFYTLRSGFEEVVNKTGNGSLAVELGMDYKIKNLNKTLVYLQELWEKEDYYLLGTETGNAKKQFGIEKAYFDNLNKSLHISIESYNKLVDQLYLTKENLEDIKKLILTNETKVERFNKIANDFKSLVLSFHEKSEEKEKLIKKFEKNAGIDSFMLESRKEVLKKELEMDIYYDILCDLSSVCIDHPSISERAEQSEFNLAGMCDEVKDLGITLSRLNDSVEGNIKDYPDSDDFWFNIGVIIKNLKQDKVSAYLRDLPKNKTNTDLIKELLPKGNFLEAEEYPEYNLKNALIFELIRQKPDDCVFADTKISIINNVDIEKIQIDENKSSVFAVSLKEPALQCCVFGNCGDCCLIGECKELSSNFPIIFIHGHAVDKDVSAEYSLEGFNKIQNRLEDDGYLNAGTITLYTEKDSTEGVWGWPNVPLAIRASYYFDVFKHPENYVVVQAKSESIDTYSIRLKELIDFVKYKTGKPKINIVAFSMGGLVARRYVQIFGAENVEKLILIGTPNKGIVGAIADYCPITGERLECRDMNSDSLFINKLNSDNTPKIKIYNIVGTGCNMEEEKGDGVVLESKALLEGAKNYVINGTCKSKTEPLHLDLRNIDLYPKVYDIIKTALKED